MIRITRILQLIISWFAIFSILAAFYIYFSKDKIGYEVLDPYIIINITTLKKDLTDQGYKDKYKNLWDYLNGKQLIVIGDPYNNDDFWSKRSKLKSGETKLPPILQTRNC